MTKRLLHICECYMSFQLRLEELVALVSVLLGVFFFFFLKTAFSKSEAEEQGMWLWLGL